MCAPGLLSKLVSLLVPREHIEINYSVLCHLNHLVGSKFELDIEIWREPTVHAIQSSHRRFSVRLRDARVVKTDSSLTIHDADLSTAHK